MTQAKRLHKRTELASHPKDVDLVAARYQVLWTGLLDLANRSYARHQQSPSAQIPCQPMLRPHLTQREDLELLRDYPRTIQ
ncbi:hypothetical protein D3C72_2190400 [compost metagenome]